ncbi:sensitivity to high expression protein she9 [Knufia peltigerae]|uniref:Sensitive to high expression protein 9, mitochondrial n=1 Tax=Knufia peltigerae TaxID=1002370 RepID=A0AA39D1R3_9EURO|nr:sensitivity to high expression protein she9 [Knufia peltigerae]
MQQAPLRLSQTLWSAFRAAKPAHRPLPRRFSSVVRHSPQRWNCRRSGIAVQARFYSDTKPEIDRKVEDAKSRIEDSLDARADHVAEGEKKLKDFQDETIVHTIPESSSIVYTKTSEEQTTKKPTDPPPSTDKSLPSDFSSRYSHIRRRFTDFMDNFQTHVFVASRRLNDLTGYSGIEELKHEIEHQELVVQESRRAVKEARGKYSEAIATRSQTQREVNDLLHRKHTWSAADLERFTSLYRSDHANEQTEAAAQNEVHEAEARYEEASTKLARAILARYHEEQIWSDKIRQMSTWGTWGLMGLNVLLFVVFQIAVEPWRRKRLVKGFEEKVELALKERDGDKPTLQATTATTPAVEPNGVGAVAAMSTEDKVEAVADNIAEQIVDAVSGTTAEQPEPAVASQAVIEEAAEQVAAQELAEEEVAQGTPETIIPGEPVLEPSRAQEIPAGSRWVSPESPLAWYEDAVRTRWNDEQKVTLSQRELTTVAMEGVAGGMALMGLLFVLLRPR